MENLVVPATAVEYDIAAQSAYGRSSLITCVGGCCS